MMTNRHHKNGTKPAEFKLNKTQTAVILLFIALAGIIWLYAARQKRPSEMPEIRTYPVMGTIAVTRLYGAPEIREKASDKVHDILFEIEKTCSIFNPQSEISRLNLTAAEKPFACSPMLWDVLQAGRKAWMLSGGTFDITIRPLMLRWGFYRAPDNQQPSPAEIGETLKIVGLDKVIFDDRNHTVKFTIKGLGFDLGGYVKGYAVAQAADAVKKLGVKRGIINLGGNLYCFPQPPPGKNNYTIGIRDPFTKDKTCGKVELTDMALATSGNYERYVSINGKQYTHIMNIKTGRPVQDVYSVTVITHDALDADILSTSIFINGPEFARNICRNIPGTQVLFIRRSTAADKPEIIRIGNIWKNIKL